MNGSDDHLIVAKIVGYYGLQGWVRLKLYTDSVEGFMAFNDYFIEKGNQFDRLDIEHAKMQGKSLIVKFTGINDRTTAEALGKVSIFVLRESLPDLDGDEYYWYQLMGLRVNAGDQCLGEVSHLLETGSNDVLVVKPCEGSLDKRERLLPYRPEVVTRIDLNAGIITVDWDSEF